MLKAYKFRLYPTKSQRDYFLKTFGCVRFVYNMMLEERIRLYEESKLNPDAKQKLPIPAKYKPEFPFLKEVGGYFSLELLSRNEIESFGRLGRVDVQLREQDDLIDRRSVYGVFPQRKLLGIGHLVVDGTKSI